MSGEHPDTPAGDDAAARRIGALAALPLFHKLDGRRVVVAGGSDGVAWKVELLAAAGARVDVYAAQPGDALCAFMSSGAAAARVTLHERPWTPDVLHGARLALADVEGEAEAEAFRCAARLAGTTVNVVDKPAFCDVQFGSIVNRSPLIIGISTDGAAPVFGQAIRARVEALLPDGLRRWAEAARDWRPAVQARGLGFRARRAFWERFTALALARPGDAPTPDDRAGLLAMLDKAETTRPGSVAFVGAGPGDPDLVTLKAVRALQSADVILHDDLVDGRILDLARREARRVGVGKRGGRASWTQADIIALLLKEAGAGARVVRLKGGDPAIFGRLSEELAACVAAGLPVEVVPGITAASGAAAALGISLTQAAKASRLQFVTAHAPDGSLPTDLDWAALADPRATTAVYMGARTAPALVARLVAEGLPPATPAAIVVNATLASERSIRCRLDEVAAGLEEHGGGGPALILIGAVAGAQGRAPLP
ncbi:siroheme synthase CysG [Alsobacter sp. R-9]